MSHDLLERKVESFEQFVDEIYNCKVFKVTPSEIYVYHQDMNKIVIVNKELFIESLFMMQEKDEPINGRNSPKSLKIQPMQDEGGLRMVNKPYADSVAMMDR